MEEEEEEGGGGRRRPATNASQQEEEEGRKKDSPSNNSPAAELELRIVGNNSVNEPLIRPDRPLSHNERQNRLLMLGGVMWARARTSVSRA